MRGAGARVRDANTMSAMFLHGLARHSFTHMFRMCSNSMTHTHKLTFPEIQVHSEWKLGINNIIQLTLTHTNTAIWHKNS